MFKFGRVNGRLELGERLLHAVEALGEYRLAGGEDDPEVSFAFGSVAGAVCGGYSPFLAEVVGHLGAREAVFADIGPEDVGALGGPSRLYNVLQ